MKTLRFVLLAVALLFGLSQVNAGHGQRTGSAGCDGHSEASGDCAGVNRAELRAERRASRGRLFGRRLLNRGCS